MQELAHKPLPPEFAPKPTIALLSYAWRFVLERYRLFAGLSGLFCVANVASYVAAEVVMSVLRISSDPNIANGKDILVGGVIMAAASSFIAVPVWAGICGVTFRIFDRDPEPMKGFSVLQQKFGSIFTVSFIGGLVTVLLRFVSWVLLRGSPGHAISWLLVLVIEASIALAIPAVVRYDLTAWDAMAYSVKRFNSRTFAYLGYYLGALVLSLSGALACGIGVFFTLGVGIVAPTLLMLVPENVEAAVAPESIDQVDG